MTLNGRGPLPAAEGRNMNQHAMPSICREIMEIMKTYREQIEKSGYIDTPGGLEHMGDVWSLLARWDRELRE